MKDSGWPFGLDELRPYYARTHKWLRLGENNFEPAYWESAIHREDVKRHPFPSGKVRDTISQFSPPVRFGKVYREQLVKARHVRVFLHANASRHRHRQRSEDDRHRRRRHASSGARRFTVRSSATFVLATGGIENARLLLASNRVQAAGARQRPRSGGRYFWTIRASCRAGCEFRKAWTRNKLYDIKYHYQNTAVAAHGTYIVAVRADEGRGSSARNCSMRRGVVSSRSFAARTLLVLKRRSAQAGAPEEGPAGLNFATDVPTMMTHPVDTACFGLARMLQPRPLITEVKIQTIVRRSLSATAASRCQGREGPARAQSA